MLIKATTIPAALFFTFLTSCSLMQKGTMEHTHSMSPDPNPELVKRAQAAWWKQFNDAALNKDIAAAIAANPDLQAVATRIAQADAAVASANASLLPRVNIGLGYQLGREREADFGPYTMAPWRSSAMLGWELDLSGKLRAARRSASANKNASVWDYHAAKLELASRIASIRFNLYRFNAEAKSFDQSIIASKQMTAFLNEQLNAGLIAASELHKQQAEQASIERQQLDIIRLRDLSIIQLHTLRGGSSPSNTSKEHFPNPRSLSKKPINQLLTSHPSLLAAEARVRAAFQLERSAQLNLLPSFGIRAGASGGQTSLTNRYKVWTSNIGPTLDIPIYDPRRIAVANARKAQRQEAAALYQKTVLQILAEVETARVNLHSHSAQILTLQREVAALQTTLKLSNEQFQAGLISQTNYLDTERRWLESVRSMAALKQAKLAAHINFIKALGGGEGF